MMLPKKAAIDHQVNQISWKFLAFSTWTELNIGESLVKEPPDMFKLFLLEKIQISEINHV